MGILSIITFFSPSLQNYWGGAGPPDPSPGYGSDNTALEYAFPVSSALPEYQSVLDLIELVQPKKAFRIIFPGTYCIDALVMASFPTLKERLNKEE